MQSRFWLVFRYSAFAIVLVSVIQFAPLGNSAKHIQDFTYENMASVIGIGAAIPDNEFNSLAQALEQKQTELTEREKSLIAREEALGREYRETIAANNKLTLIVLGIVSLVLILLVLFNFYLDWKRGVSASHPSPHEGELQTRL